MRVGRHPVSVWLSESKAGGGGVLPICGSVGAAQKRESDAGSSGKLSISLHWL